MKIKDFANVIFSRHGSVQWVIVWSYATGDIVNGCSAEYAYANFGDLEVVRIQADGDRIVFCVE